MGFLDRLKAVFRVPTDENPVVVTEPKTIPVNEYFQNDSLIEGYEFCATLQLRVPLEVLRHHGDMFYGPPQVAPKFGEWGNGYSADGIWVPKVKSWTQLAIENGGNVEFCKRLGPEPECPCSADIGPVLPSEYLPFLLAFREIVEGEPPIPEKISAVGALEPSFRAIYKRVVDSHPGFPESFFLGRPKKMRNPRSRKSEATER